MFMKTRNMKFHKNLSRELSLMRTDGQADRHDDASSGFSQLCERAWKLNYAQVFTRFV